MRVRTAIKNDDYGTARRITAEALANSRLESYRFYPFDTFMAGIADLNDPEFKAHLNAWVARADKDPLPLLVRAQYYYQRGWRKRGHHFASETQASGMAAFSDDMVSALSDIDASLHLDDRNPYGSYLRLLILRGFGASAEMKSAFDEAIAKHPGYYPLYEVALRTLEPKWGGSVGEMYAFVDRYAGQAPEWSPLKLLYLELDRDLLDSASTACWPLRRERDRMSQCVAAAMKKVGSQEVEPQIELAFQLYDHSDPYPFGLAVGNILSALLGTEGGDAHAGAILELAATSLHTDTQLRPDEQRHGSYVIDEAVAESWYLKGFYDNALEKHRQALRDIGETAFPTEDAKDLAVATVYKSTGKALSRLGRLADMIAYEKAAIALGGDVDEEYRICYGYYQLKDYNSAVQACTKALNDTSDIKAHFWRGVSYRDWGQTDAAVKDLTIVADSEDNFRTTAAIDLSMIYFGLQDNQGALNLLNRYTYLYDLKTNNRDDIAVSYNNRCYAYMQLGQLREALNDCQESLKYGSIPDAFSKQRELIRRLEAGHTGL